MFFWIFIFFLTHTFQNMKTLHLEREKKIFSSLFLNLVKIDNFYLLLWKQCFELQSPDRAAAGGKPWEALWGPVAALVKQLAAGKNSWKLFFHSIEDLGNIIT